MYYTTSYGNGISALSLDSKYISANYTNALSLLNAKNWLDIFPSKKDWKIYLRCKRKNTLPPHWYIHTSCPVIPSCACSSFHLPILFEINRHILIYLSCASLQNCGHRNSHHSDTYIKICNLNRGTKVALKEYGLFL